jgi:hypothetical protein
MPGLVGEIIGGGSDALVSALPLDLSGPTSWGLPHNTYHFWKEVGKPSSLDVFAPEELPGVSYCVFSAFEQCHVPSS